MPVLDYQVASSADDGCWWATTFQKNSTVLYFGYYNVYLAKVFARFVDVTIPKGARITAAYMSFNFSHINGTAPECTLSFEKTANPAAVSSVADGDSRTLTTNNIGYTVTDVPGWRNTADISTIIQELVDAYDYSAGSAMQMIVCGGGPGMDHGKENSWDADSNLLGPKLHIEYVLGELGTHSFRGMFRGMFNQMR